MKRKNIGWSSAENTENSHSGLNHAGIENFKDDPLYHVPRELTQDALDASNPHLNEPVHLEFKTFSFKKGKENLLSLDELTNIIKATRDSWSHDLKTYNYFDKMYTSLKNEDEIIVLAVRDYNTLGLSGVTSGKGRWDSLVKGSGFSDKAIGSNGSRGLGKHAPFLASKYSTVLYGTLNTQGEKGFQGVAKLATYEKQGIKYRENVYYGDNENFTAITDLSFLTKDFKREKIGTDKFILGFNFDKNWKKNFVKVISESFLLAIYEEKLIVDVDGIEISKRTLTKIIDDICREETSGHHIIKEFYSALSSNEHKFTLSININGITQPQPVVLHLIKDKSFSNKVSMNRASGMKIFNKENFRKPPANFSGFLIIQGTKLNEILSETETATHKGWHVNLNENLDKEEKEKNIEVKKIINKINTWISKKVHALAPKMKKEAIDLLGFEKILPKKSENPEPVTEISEGALLDEIKSIKIVPRSLSQRKPTTRKGRPKGTTPLPNPKPRSRPNSKNKKGDISKVRSIYDESNGVYKVILTPKVGGNVKIKIQAIGENGKSVDVSLKDAKMRKDNQLTPIPIINNLIGPFKLIKNERYVLHITLNELTSYSLEVSTV